MYSINERMVEDGFENPIKLNKPILINGKQVDTLEWSGDDLTVELFCQADTLAGSTAKSPQVVEFDSKKHIYLGEAMIISVNPEIDFRDFEQLRGMDIFKVMNLGRFLAMHSEASEESEPESSSDFTPENTQPQPEKSEQNHSSSSSKK